MLHFSLFPDTSNNSDTATCMAASGWLKTLGTARFDTDWNLLGEICTNEPVVHQICLLDLDFVVTVPHKPP